MVFFFEQKTADDMRISDWSSDVCSSDLFELGPINAHLHLLDEAGYIRASAAQDANTPYGYMMQDASLTWAGYEVLETIRDTEIWRLTKTGAEKVGSWGISMLMEIGRAHV